MTYEEFEANIYYLNQQISFGAYGIPEKGEHIDHMISRLALMYPEYYKKYKNKHQKRV